MTNTDTIPNGSTVKLDDGTTAVAYFDPRDRTYWTVQTNPVTGGVRTDEGWRREQLTVLAPDMSDVWTMGEWAQRMAMVAE
jgi:hypothetical protein